MTYEQLQLDGLPNMVSGKKKSQSSPRDSRASLTALQEKVAAIVTSVTSGARLQELSEKFDRNGSSVKIRPVYSQEAISGTFAACLTTLPRWGILSAGEYGELVTSVPRISGNAYSLWLTPIASDGKRSLFSTKVLSENWEKRGGGTNLAEQVAYQEIFPTPTVKGNYNRKGSSPKAGDGLATVVGGKLNQTWVEWLMGFPIGWTDLDA